MTPLVSIIVPVYKVEEYLSECVDSILSQSYENFEIILVNDGSPDHCPQICDDYANKDIRIKVIHKNNGGLSDARNIGLKAASGEYVIFVDSDDYWDDATGIQQLIEQIRQNPQVDIVFFRFKNCINGKFFHPIPINVLLENPKEKSLFLKQFSLLGDLQTSAWIKLVRRSVLIDNGIEFEKGLLGEDIDWSLKLYIRAKEMRIINSTFYCYRMRAGSITTTMKKKNFTDLLYIINKWRKIIPEQPIPIEEKCIYMGFLCYEYCILMGLLGRADKSTRKDLMPQLKEMVYLLKYDVSYKTHRVAVLYKLFGFKFTCWILRQYIKYRSKNL